MKRKSHASHMAPIHVILVGSALIAMLLWLNLTKAKNIIALVMLAKTLYVVNVAL
jgi:hypothetical protein